MTVAQAHSVSRPPASSRAATPAPAVGDAKRPAAAAAQLVTWMERERRSGGLHFSADRVLEVAEPVSQEFAVGDCGQRQYVGFPLAQRWMLELPWLHLAVNRREGALALVCDRFLAGTAVMPEVALSFRCISREAVEHLANYQYVDIRTIERVNGSAAQYRLSGSLGVLPVRIADGDQTFTALLDGCALTKA